MGVLVWFSFLFLVACSTGGVNKVSGGRPFPVIDAHLHTNFDDKVNKFSGITKGMEAFKAEAAAAGVVGGISHAPGLDYKPPNLGPTHIFCTGIKTLTFDLRVIERGLKEKTYHCIKLYLGYVPRGPDHPAYEPVYQLARKYKVPVVFHTGDTLDPDGLVKYAHPLAIDEVAVKHRDINFVIAHLGNPWINTAAEVVYKNRNLYADVSALLIGDMSEIPVKNQKRYIADPIEWTSGFIENPKKLMYGTDWPLSHMGKYIDIVKQAVPKEHWDAVFYDNAMRVFNISGLPPTAAEYRKLHKK